MVSTKFLRSFQESMRWQLASCSAPKVRPFWMDELANHWVNTTSVLRLYQLAWMTMDGYIFIPIMDDDVCLGMPCLIILGHQNVVYYKNTKPGPGDWMFICRSLRSPIDFNRISTNWIIESQIMNFLTVSRYCIIKNSTQWILYYSTFINFLNSFSNSFQI